MTISVNQKELVWALKYRPQHLNEMVLPDRIRDQLNEALEGKSSHMLFAGDPGLGKTTAAYAIANDMDASLMYINASLETGIDVIREKLTQFCTSISAFGKSSRKIVILDEVESMSTQAFQAFRGFLEQYAKYAMFILTTNYVNRIPDPIISRMNVIDFSILPDEKKAIVAGIYKRSCDILDLEGIEYDKTIVAKVIAAKFPDFRGIVTSLQKGVIKGKLESIVLQGGDAKYNEVVQFTINKEWGKMRQWIADNINSFDYSAFYGELARVLGQSSKLPEIVIHTSNYDYRSQFVVSKEITATAYLTEVMGVL